MRLKDYAILAVVGFLIALCVAVFESAPGYMDADYYYASALRLTQGHGFSEMVLWNYLDDPAGLPHPSHAYWMPLPALLAAAGMWVSGSQAFWAARLGALALAAFLPVLTAGLCFSLTARRDQAWLAGALALFSGFYAPFLVTTDAFGLVMVLGGLFLWFLQRLWQPDREAKAGWWAFGLGMIAGGLHLSRADGVLWLGIALLGILYPAGSEAFSLRGWTQRLRPIIACLVGYLLVMGPWFVRNLMAFGVILAPGGGRALWLTEYDQLYVFPASQLTPDAWWQSGLGAIASARLWALGLNLQTALGVQGLVFLLPLILLGLWRLRQQPGVRWGSAAWVLTFVMMTVVFPYAGARGGFFHSGAAFQPLFWAMAPVGLQSFLEWGVRRRGWQTRQAQRVFRTALIILAALITLFIFSSRVIGDDWKQPAWNQDFKRYALLEQHLKSYSDRDDEVVMVNNPPGYFIASQRPAIAIPYGDLETLLIVAERFQAAYLLIELDQVQGVALFTEPGNYSGLTYLETFEDVRLYRIDGVHP
jgi:hypothetical protein